MSTFEYHLDKAILNQVFDNLNQVVEN